MPKETEAFRNIGEVSSELGIKKHVLRFWELKFPQLKPMKRGGGRRLYRPADVQLLCGIRNLLQTAGYTIKGVQKILRDHGVEHVKAAATSVAAGLEKGRAEHRPPAVSVRAKATLFTAAEVRALRAIVTELEACEALLGAAARDSNGHNAQGAKGVASRG
ncbi:MAG: MerR family transcriptional regulator [Hyphomicrobiaceae bacterium]|nr:MAG: MerR family transcriptional regulator [Hyphomicrobiaceae bacterium]